MMSRCFPFPPPGYEVRPRSEHKDLLKKEKRKKKHRKDEHREKRERKEKDRDHRKDKHNKKHKREKRREKRKDRDRDKAKNLPLEQGSQKNYDLGNRKPEERVQNEAVKDIKPTDELVSRNFGQGHANHKCSNTRELLPQMADSIGATGSKEKEINLLSRMVKKSAQATQDNHGLVQKSDSIPRANKKGMSRGVDSKTRMKNGRNLQVGSAEKHSSRRHGCNGVNLLQDNSDTERTSECVHTSTVVSVAGRGANGSIVPSPNTLQMAEEMGQHPVISVHSANGRSERIGIKGMTGKENQSANNCRGKMDQHFVQSEDGAVEGKENTKEMRTNYFKGVKGKDRDLGEKKRKKNIQKEMEKNGNVNEQNHEDLDALGASKVDDLMCLACLNEQKFASDNIKKRKDLDADSSPHEHSMRTSKLSRMSPTNLACANGEISQHSPGIAPYPSTELVGTHTCEVDQHKLQDSRSDNGITGSHYSEERIASVSSSGYDSNKGYLKLPHPDTKYLSQVHFIPAVDFPEYIDQDWLFPEDHVERKTAKSVAAESRQVWSDAQLIDTADVVAFPYVVPL